MVILLGLALFVFVSLASWGIGHRLVGPHTNCDVGLEVIGGIVHLLGAGILLFACLAAANGIMFIAGWR